MTSSSVFQVLLLLATAAGAEAFSGVRNSPGVRRQLTSSGSGAISGGSGGEGYDCDVCSACFAKSAELRVKEREWSSLFQIKGQVARKAKEDLHLAERFDEFKNWTWATSAEELRADEKKLLGEMEEVNDALKAAHKGVLHARHEFPVECEGDASPLTSVRGRRTLTRLDPDLYPDRPDVSFVLQYFKQPSNVKWLADYYHSCTNGRLGDDGELPNPNPGITSELIVNVDNQEEAAQWLEQQREKGDFISLLFSPNIHEIRGYNRGAGVASGRIVVFLQDDDIPADGCKMWVKNLVAQFDAHARLGVVGMKKACFSRWGKCMYAEKDVKFTDPTTDVGFQFVSVADFAPFAVRRTAFMDVGMLDEGMAPAGESGILSDYEFCERVWGAGWQVGQMVTPKLKGCEAPLKCEGGTSHGMGLKLRKKNQELDAITFDMRIRFREHVEIFEEVQRANAQLLKPKEGVDPDALWAADKDHAYYKRYINEPEKLALIDKDEAEVKRAEAVPIPKEPIHVSKNMRAQRGRIGRRAAAGSGGGSVDSSSGEGGDEPQDVKQSGDQGDADVTERGHDAKETVPDDEMPKPSSLKKIRAQEEAYLKKHKHHGLNNDNPD